jgi:hypothetical protein
MVKILDRMVADITTIDSGLNILMFSHLFDIVNQKYWYLQFSKDLQDIFFCDVLLFDHETWTHSYSSQYLRLDHTPK